MAANIWLGSTSNVETAGNWSAGTVLADGEDGIFNHSCTAGPQGDLTTAEDVDAASLRFIGGFDNSVGVDASSPLIIDSATTVEVDVNGGPSQAIYLKLTNGCTNLVVRRTSGNPYGFYYVNGAITGTVVINGGNVVFGANASFGAAAEIVINKSGDGTRPAVTFLAGCAFNAASQVWLDDGQVTCYTPMAGLLDIQRSGQWYHVPTTGTPTMLRVNCAGLLDVTAGVATTITMFKGYGNGKLITRGTYAVTLTNATVTDDAVLDTRPGIDVYSNAPTVSGNASAPVNSTFLTSK